MDARTAEKEHRLADALETWTLVRSVHPGFPGLDAEIARLEARKHLQTDYGRREDLFQQIRTAIDAHEFAGALHLVDSGAAAFGRDPEFGELRAAAEAGAERERLAGDLLRQSAELAENRRYGDALKKLDEASALGVRKREIVAARHHVLVGQAQSVIEKDWRRAKTLLKQALELTPGRDITNKLLEQLEERSRRERVIETTDHIRQLERTHDFDGALRATEQALAENPDDPELAQTAARLRRRGDSRMQRAAQPSSAPETVGQAFLKAAWDKASAMAHRSRANSARIRQPSTASLSARGEGTHGGGIAFAEKTPSNAAAPTTPRPEIRRPFAGPRQPPRISSLLLALLGATVAVALVLAFLLPRRHNPVRVAPPPPPAVAQGVSTATVPLHISPGDAQLMVDGSPVSLRDGMLAVTIGTHVIDVRSPGYTPLTRSIEVGAQNNAPVDIALVPIPVAPALHVETDLQSGSVVMDNKRIGVLEGGQFSQDAPAGRHTVVVFAPTGGHYVFEFALGEDPVWIVATPESTAYGTPVVAALSRAGARIVCGRAGLTFELDGGQPLACTAAGKDLPPLSNGNHTLTLLDGPHRLAVHTLDYDGSPLLAALITTGAQFGGLAIQGTEDTFDVSVNGYSSKRPAAGGHWRRLLKPGNYTIAISKPGFRANPSTLNVSVGPGVDTLEQVSFTPLPQHAHLRLESQPGTEVSVNGKLAGTVPETGVLDLPQLATGAAELRLHHKGFADTQQTVTLGNGDNQRTILLQELKAKVTVDVDPPNAQIVYFTRGNSVRHAVTGNTIELPAGTYQFEASAPGRTPASSVLAVDAGESKTVSLRLTAPYPTVRDLDVWPGWELQNGWLTRDKPGPIFRTLPEHPSRVAFSVRWERPKTLVHWSAGSLNLLFRTADGARTIGFRITEHGTSWSVAGQGQRRDGKFPLNLAKSPETIQADIRVSGIALTINCTALAPVGPNLSAEPKPLQFGFVIEQDQTVRLAGIRVTMQPAVPN
ncbi:MAG: hypothetical protein JO270_03870 [Acidobacteriaceae bacterium]|nr:hypothetical protein [Acidobacteriaceae bacterium]